MIYPCFNTLQLQIIYTIENYNHLLKIYSFAEILSFILSLPQETSNELRGGYL